MKQRTEVIYGFHPVREALRGRPHRVVRVLVERRRSGGRRREVEELCKRRGLALEETADLTSVLGDAGAVVHNGFAAELRTAESEPLASQGDRELVVLVEDVQDPRNLGAILRVCEGAGVGRVLVRDRGSAPLSASVERTSAGALGWVDIERITNSARAIEELKKEGFWVYGADVGGTPPWDLDLSGPVALCLGGEEKGLRARTRKLCDGLVGLPMRGRVESLNVATAASALLFEAVRQRYLLSEGGGKG